MKKKILIVEDDITFATMLNTWLTKKGFETSCANSFGKACQILDEKDIDLIISDVRLPDCDGTMLLTWLKERNRSIPVIIMTSYADIQSAVNAMKNGAYDYVSKPIHPTELLEKIEESFKSLSVNSSAKSGEREENGKKEKKTEKNSALYIEGCSESARLLYNYVGLVAPTPMSVLINGASGTGKEYVAHRIHMQSKRADKPFIAIDCGAIPKELAASEFFGHIKGSFTGAVSDKDGAFLEANGGTLFLDEVGNLSYEVQIQLLRAIQERRIRPVGATKEIEIDVRIVSATNEDLQVAIERGRFREDLYHRLNEFTLQMPSLRERKEDILLFANHFLDAANKELERNVVGFDKEASQLIQEYHWPGNLRQLKNIVKRATLLAQNKFITANELDIPKESSPNLQLHNGESEKKQIIEALQQAGNNKTKAATLLCVDRKTLYNKIAKYNLE